jgi:hypothetical protein
MVRGHKTKTLIWIATLPLCLHSAHLLVNTVVSNMPLSSEASGVIAFSTAALDVSRPFRLQCHHTSLAMQTTPFYCGLGHLSLLCMKQDSKWNRYQAEKLSIHKLLSEQVTPAALLLPRRTCSCHRPPSVKLPCYRKMRVLSR